MNPGPGTCWPDLHYVETEQVQLDVAVIIARGTRLRRKRMATKAVAVAVVAAIAPTAVVMDMRAPAAPKMVVAGPIQSSPPSNGHGVMNVPIFGTNTAGLQHVAGPGSAAAPVPTAGTKVGNPLAGIFNGDLTYAPAQAVVYRATTLSRRYGPMLAIAGARAGTGLWFAATAAQLTLFHLSVTGAMKSWRLSLSASSVHATPHIALAVSVANVAWLGVASTLLRFDAKTAQISSWQMPAPRASRAAGRSEHPTWPGYSAAESLAISPAGYVAIAMPYSSSVQVLNPSNGRFRQIRLPDPTDQAIAVGYARDGTLGIGYQHVGRRPAPAVLLVSRGGEELSTPVVQPTAVTAYGASGLLVGITKLVVVSTQGAARPLLLPENTDFADVRSPPAALPGDRLGIALDTAILTFPATATSYAVATAQSELWVAPTPPCRPHRACPVGYRLAVTDAAGDMWVVPAASQRTVELVNLR